jgi:hypothetical protein
MPTAQQSEIQRALQAIRTGPLCEPCLRLLPVTGVAVSTLSGPIHADTVCATDDTAFGLEEMQFDLGEGPCWEAFASRRPVSVPDLWLPEQPRWPLFAEAVRKTRARAFFAYPLSVGATAVGVMDLYCSTPGALNDPAEHEAGVLAGAVAAELLNRVLSAEDVDLMGGANAGRPSPWRDHPQDRRAIHQATGMLMAQLDLPVGAAYARLRGHAFASGMTVADVAAAMVARTLMLNGDS